MKIAFWSNVRGKNGVTSNLACVSVMGALMEKQKALVLENHYNMNNMEQALLGRPKVPYVKEESYFYNQVGMDSLIKRIHSNMADENTVRASSIPLLDDSIYYIPQNYITNKEFFEYEFNQVLHPLFQVLEQFSKIIYVDTAGSAHLSSKVILNEADLVVVNLSQNPAVLSDFFKNYSALQEKAVYLIGNYNSDSKFNLRNIIRKYHIDRTKIGVIPYNVEFADAISEGAVIRFLLRNFDCDRQDVNYDFIREVKKSARIIHQHTRPHVEEGLFV